VSVVGTFNKWDPEKNPMRANPGSGHYTTVIALTPGKHEYRFVVNGEWCMDSNCFESVPNGYGSLNSVICIQT
jgi:1,4-alpha-glucan branching enzyme